MPGTFLIVLASVSLPALVLTKLGAPGGLQKLTHDTADALKVFESFPHVVALSDSNNDTIFECMEANRTAFDPIAKTATFVWAFGPPGSSNKLYVPFPQRVGNEPGTIEFWTPGDSTPREGRLYYTDYDACAVLDFEILGHQCSLWVRRDAITSLPQECVDQYEDTCGVVVPEQRKDLCADSNINF
ncbi:uncharacterized protein [Dermacentor andersoni]|uniref:uncharacterized protein n=1 Tax=Dermacentor andersoni TaxID=34620 RepID=UPI0024159B19|nr:uncharacterized protein LOC129382674 [Dermacentor andersoni]